MYWDATKALGQGRVQLKEIENRKWWKVERAYNCPTQKANSGPGACYSIISFLKRWDIPTLAKKNWQSEEAYLCAVRRERSWTWRCAISGSLTPSSWQWDWVTSLIGGGGQKIGILWNVGFSRLWDDRQNLKFALYCNQRRSDVKFFRFDCFASAIVLYFVKYRCGAQCSGSWETLEQQRMVEAQEKLMDTSNS